MSFRNSLWFRVIFLQPVLQTYREMGAVEGTDQDIEFEDDKITLEISEKDSNKLGGWTILALTPPRVSSEY